MPRRAAKFAIFAALLLAACAGTQQRVLHSDESNTAVADSRAVITLLEAYQNWQAMPEEGVSRELAAANAAYAQQADDESRLRLALLLSMPNAGVHNDARALALLAPMLAPDSAPPRPLRELALLLQTQIDERMRAVNEEQKRNDDLARKLEALRKLERSLVDREQRAREK
jgi:hypothetical protein